MTENAPDLTPKQPDSGIKEEPVGTLSELPEETPEEKE